MSQTATPVLAPEIMSVLADVARPLFTAQGLTDEEASGLLISSTNSNPLHRLSQRLETYVNNFFVLEMGGTEKAEQLLAAGQCKRLLVVRPEPLWQDRSHDRRALILGEDASRRVVDSDYVNPKNRWNQNCWFARFRNSLHFSEPSQVRFCLYRFHLPRPAAQHPPDFGERFGECDVFFIIQCFEFPCYLQEKLESIKLGGGSPYPG